MRQLTSMVPVAALAALEQAVNAALALDPFTQARLTSLQGKVIAIDISGTGLLLHLAPQADGLRLMGSYDGQADTTLRGAPLSLLRMTASRPGEGLFSGDVTIEGDVELGQKLQNILRSLNIDWEEHMSRLTGDVVGHQLGRAARGLKDFARNAASTLGLDLGEYLQEERRTVPGRSEVEAFVAEVDQLRMASDRLAARIKRLHQALHDSDKAD